LFATGILGWIVLKDRPGDEEFAVVGTIKSIDIADPLERLGGRPANRADNRCVSHGVPSGCNINQWYALVLFSQARRTVERSSTHQFNL
jgi:hypothetical protein